MSDFTSLLYRPIRNGNVYDKLFPKASCKSTYVGSGDTFFSVDQMRSVIEQFKYQTEAVSELLAKPTLLETIYSIHDFLYNHFQYKADAADQMLRSPACSWHERKKGIDCKSYSILASCILSNLGYTHYIRQIKQAGYEPEHFTHVYVVVPTDQKNGLLDSGYYCIDGTLPTIDEPLFTEKSDLIMKHYALNAPALNSSSNGSSWIDVLGKNSSISKIVCYGSTYDSKNIEWATERSAQYIGGLFDEINNLLSNNNVSQAQVKINTLLATVGKFLDHATKTAAYNWGGCSKNVVVEIQKLAAFYYNMIDSSFMLWLESLCIFNENEISTLNNDYGRSDYSLPFGLKKTEFKQNCNVNQVQNLVYRSGVTFIPFTPTNYVMQTGKSGDAKILELMKSFGFIPTENNTTGSNTQTFTATNEVDANNAGFSFGVGSIVTIGIVAAGAYYFSQKKSGKND